MSLQKQTAWRPLAGSVTSLLFTHSLRCGLKESRQLRWLKSTLRICSVLIRTLLMQLSIKPKFIFEFGGTANAVPFQTKYKFRIQRHAKAVPFQTEHKFRISAAGQRRALSNQH